MKVLSIKFPETRFPNQEIFKKVRGTGQESRNFDHLDTLIRLTVSPGPSRGTQFTSDQARRNVGKDQRPAELSQL